VPTNTDINIAVTLRLPRALERSFAVELFFHLFCIGMIFWGTKMAETERHLEETRRDAERQLEQARRSEEAADLAHDIRSPLAALDSAMEDVGGFPNASAS